jgi:hypothetical protein
MQMIVVQARNKTIPGIIAKEEVELVEVSTFQQFSVAAQ